MNKNEIFKYVLKDEEEKIKTQSTFKFQICKGNQNTGSFRYSRRGKDASDKHHLLKR